MPCPSCGGTSRKPIAPGYWECTTAVDNPRIVKSAWDVADPWRAATFPKCPCGHRYREDPSIAEADANRRRERQAAAEQAALERQKLERSVEAAIQKASAALRASDRPRERVAALRLVVVPKGPGGGAKSWLDIGLEMGQGWYIGDFAWTPSMFPPISDSLVLTEDGRLLTGDQDCGLRVQLPGRWWFFSKKIAVLAVDRRDFMISHCEVDSLKELAAFLLESPARRSE